MNKCIFVENFSGRKKKKKMFCKKKKKNRGEDDKKKNNEISVEIKKINKNSENGKKFFLES